MLAGDFNARVGQRVDVFDNINWDRFVDMLLYDVLFYEIQFRLSKVNHSNVFRNKSYHYAKKTVCLIVNGLLKSSYFTRHTFTRNTFTASVVDYVILNNLLSVI